MRRRRSTFLAALSTATAVTLLAAACSGATSDPTAGEETGGETTALQIGVTIHQADVYFQSIADVVASTVEADGGSMTLVNTQTDASTEATGFQNLISAQVDGIVTSPLSPEGSLASVQAAADAGIPIICYNTCLGDASEDVAEAFIESDQYDLGAQTGEYAAAALEEDGESTAVLAMLNCNRFEACQARQEGFLAALEEAGITVEIVNDQEALAADEATGIATDMLTANQDINVMWASSQSATEGMVAAVQAAGRDDLALFGTDVSPSIVNSIKDGTLQAVTGQNSAETGELAVEYIRSAINGEEISPFSVEIPGVLYSADEPEALDAYLEEQS
ncbi:substrate-binding domain-containing protein [Ruania zhangjianzhongii]|uniref:substrate-binding domain-containing protein n=1 Tax=Ruania zhangjianzhongii TaxID=2603206 RepID=UPI00143D8710|nr:substrate-binding domain-containing protein [Ruania zhangjianzhongii]